MDEVRLRAIPLFAGLSRKEREQLARWADEVEVPAGTRLVDQGAFPHEFFVISEGRAEVTIDGRPIAELGPGDFFGEIALLEGQRRTATVTSSTPLSAVVMHSRDFGSMERSLPDVAARIRQEMTRRIGRD
ncbi:MAG TPA: cyclic nucleotide-binding domain-containing protein [Actinomycetota bacterium]|jgi:CRP-like cAMP-binding protein|nr:cyclic nucleotide-binding domain-containing protein [Actinomycetota bacterium]